MLTSASSLASFVRFPATSAPSRACQEVAASRCLVLLPRGSLSAAENVAQGRTMQSNPNPPVLSQRRKCQHRRHPPAGLQGRTKQRCRHPASGSRTTHHRRHRLVVFQGRTTHHRRRRRPRPKQRTTDNGPLTIQVRQLTIQVVNSFGKEPPARQDVRRMDLDHSRLSLRVSSIPLKPELVRPAVAPSIPRRQLTAYTVTSAPLEPDIRACSP